MKKFWIVILIFMTALAPSYAKGYTTAILKHNINASVEIPKNVSFINQENIVIKNKIKIPKNSYIEGEVLKFQKELRWHKSAFLIVRLLNYTTEGSNTPTDISEDNIYLTVRKYKRFDKKEATIVTTELIAFNAADFFAPGSGTAYFFIKGAATREKHPHWFKSGISNVYDNSIFWFILKGKNLELDENDEIKVEHIKEKKLVKIIKKIDKRKLKTDKKLAKKEAKQIKKEAKALLKAEKEQAKQAKMKPEKLEKYLAKKEREQEKEEFKNELTELRDKIWKEKWDEIDDRRTEELKYFAAKKKEKREFKNNIKEEKTELKKILKTLKGKEKSIAKKEGKQNIKNEKTEFKNKLKQQKQEMKLAKKELKKETKIVKKEAKSWYKENKKLNKNEAKQIKKEPVKYSYDAASLNEKIYKRTVSQKMQTLSL